MLLEIANFILDVVASFFGYLLLLRFAMQWRRVSFNNPLGQFVLQTTNWGVLPLRKLIPGFLGLDFASLVPAWLLQVLVKGVLLASKGGALAGSGWWIAALVMGGFELLHMAVVAAIVLMLVQAVLSWVNPHTPLAGPIQALTDPLLRPLRRILPPVANVDLSPLVALVLAQVVLMLLAYGKAALLSVIF